MTNKFNPIKYPKQTKAPNSYVVFPPPTHTLPHALTHAQPVSACVHSSTLSDLTDKHTPTHTRTHTIWSGQRMNWAPESTLQEE